VIDSLTILHVEDDPDIVDLFRSFMDCEGHRVVSTYDLEQINTYVQFNQVDVVLLDYILPDTNGMDILKHIRTQSDVPVLMLSGKTDPIDKIMCIENGADDYIEKPFMPREVLARMRAVLKRSSHVNTAPPVTLEDTQKYLFDIWTLDRDRYQAYDEHGQSADLTTKEFLLLEKMVSFSHVTFERDALLGVLHDDDADVYDRTVDIYMTRIRKKLRDDPKTPKYIQTVRGIGYMFVCDVEKQSN